LCRAKITKQNAKTIEWIMALQNMHRIMQNINYTEIWTSLHIFVNASLETFVRQNVWHADVFAISGQPRVGRFKSVWFKSLISIAI